MEALTDVIGNGVLVTIGDWAFVVIGVAVVAIGDIVAVGTGAGLISII